MSADLNLYDLHEKMVRSLVKHLGGHMMPLFIDVREYRPGMWDPYNPERDKRMQDFNAKEKIQNRAFYDKKATDILKELGIE